MVSKGNTESQKTVSGIASSSQRVTETKCNRPLSMIGSPPTRRGLGLQFCFAKSATGCLIDQLNQRLSGAGVTSRR